MRWALFAALLVATLGGCTNDGDGDATGLDDEKGGTGADGNQTDNGTLGQPPTVSLSANVTNGTAPLNVTFTITISDDDGQVMNWSLDFGDGNVTNGTALPVPAGASAGANATAGNGTGNATTSANTTATFTHNVTHSYLQGGQMNATLTVMDGNFTVNATATVTVEGGVTQEEELFEGTVECLPLMVRSGALEDGEHELAVNPGQTMMTVTLEYVDGSNVDLDLYVTGPDGTEVESTESGPEPPMEIPSPMGGPWDIRVVGWSCVMDHDYTVTVTFG